MRLPSILACIAFAAVALAQGATHTCKPGTSYGQNTITYTTPYTYDQVLSIIGSFGNLTWSGSPAGSVTLNGTDNTVGTARTYNLAGAHVVETIEIYQKPPYPGPYYEVHAVAPLSIPLPSGKPALTLYSDYDATTVTPTCSGAASAFNFTIRFCSNDPVTAAPLLGMLHLGDAQTVGKFLGGRNFTSCGALAGATGSAAPAMYTGGAEGRGDRGGGGAAVAAGVGALLMAWLMGV